MVMVMVMVVLMVMVTQLEDARLLVAVTVQELLGVAVTVAVCHLSKAPSSNGIDPVATAATAATVAAAATAAAAATTATAAATATAAITPALRSAELNRSNTSGVISSSSCTSCSAKELC